MSWSTSSRQVRRKPRCSRRPLGGGGDCGQQVTALRKDSKGLVGSHGAGGGGSMMSMDAIVNAGFTIANFTHTSGNPSASKVYRASESF